MDFHLGHWALTSGSSYKLWLCHLRTRQLSYIYFSVAILLNATLVLNSNPSSQSHVTVFLLGPLCVWLHLSLSLAPKHFDPVWWETLHSVLMPLLCFTVRIVLARWWCLVFVRDSAWKKTNKHWRTFLSCETTEGFFLCSRSPLNGTGLWGTLNALVMLLYYCPDLCLTVRG